MKKQTFIAYIVNENDIMIGFERFSYKRLETVERSMKELFESELYRICNKDAKAVKIYATPDGYNRENTPALVFEV